MTREPILEILNEKSVKSLLYRLTNNGLDVQIVENALDRAMTEQKWLAVWMDVGDMYRNLGEQALADGHPASAGEYFIKASLGYHFAQFLHFCDPKGKTEAHQAKLEVHRRAHHLVSPPITALETTFEGVTLPIHVRTPPGPGPHPAVVIVCGMDSTKEEYFFLQNYMLDRGLAMVSYDGPGQGEVWPHMKMRPDYHKAVSAVADAIGVLPEVDGNRLGLMGQSFGAFLAPSVLAADTRFKAAVVNGGFFDLSHFDWANPIREIGLPYLFGVETVDEAKEEAKKYTNAHCIKDVRVPLMVIHGRLDKDAPPEAAKRIVDEASGPGRFVEFEEGIHMCHNVAYRVKPMTADWLVDNLAVAGSE